MIARLLISNDLDSIKKEIEQTLAFHLLGRLAHGLGGKLNHPDLLYFSADIKLGIEQARKIKEHFSLKPYSAKGRIVVLENAGELTLDAQNALLKTIEELSENSMFILASDSESRFLPTILSRCEIFRIRQQAIGIRNNAQLQDIERLLKSGFEERFEYVEKLKDKEEFLQALIAYFHNNLPSHMESGNTDYSDFLKELLQAEKWVKQNVNIRAILEYLMLVMPSS